MKPEPIFPNQVRQLRMNEDAVDENPRIKTETDDTKVAVEASSSSYPTRLHRQAFLVSSAATAIVLTYAYVFVHSYRGIRVVNEVRISGQMSNRRWHDVNWHDANEKSPQRKCMLCHDPCFFQSFGYVSSVHLMACTRGK